MKYTKKRGLIGALGAIATAAALALGGSAAAVAAPPQPAPESSEVLITKCEQPDTLGAPATGEQQDVTCTTINGVVFDYFLIDGTEAGGSLDIGTNAGQEWAGQQTASTVTVGGTKTGSFPATAGTGTTSATLPRGLYLVKEDPATVPAGVTAAAPFLLAVPLTNPTNEDAWLDTIYVYPKNSQVGGEKTVENAEDLKVGDTVTWSIATDIPLIENPAYDPSGDPAVTAQWAAPDAYRIDDTLQDNQLTLDNGENPAAGTNPGIRVTAGTTDLVEGTHYTVTPDAATAPGSTTYQIEFTEEGRAALAAAVNTNAAARVVVKLDTKVVAAGDITNSADFYPNQNAITSQKPVEVTPAEVKYGGIQLTKDSSDASVTDLSGAQFRVYTSEAAAKAAAGTGYLVPELAADEWYDGAGTWTTAADGSLNISGLRYTAFADGAAITDADDAYQTYWLVEVKALDEHQLLAEPLEFIVSENSELALGGTTIVNQKNTGGFVLPLTGGMGTALLTVLGVGILAAVLVAARRRRTSEAAAE